MPPNPFAKYALNNGDASAMAAEMHVGLKDDGLDSPDGLLLDVNSWPKGMKALYRTLVTKQASMIRFHDMFQEAFPFIHSKPFSMMDAGEAPVTAPVLRLYVAALTKLGSTSLPVAAAPEVIAKDLQQRRPEEYVKFLKFLAWWSFRQGDSSETYRTEEAISTSLASACKGWAGMVDTMKDAGILVEHPETDHLLTTCMRRQEERAVSSMFLGARSLLYAARDDVANVDLSAEQVECLDSAMAAPWYLLRGGPGRGKSRVVAALARIAGSHGVNVILAAPSHKATNVLRAAFVNAGQEDTDFLEIMTVQKLATRGRMANKNSGNSSNQGAKDGRPERLVVILDEASMICLSDLAGIAQYLSQVGIMYQLLLVGDEMQLPPIEAGEVFRHAIANASWNSGRLYKCFRTDDADLMAFIDGIAEGRMVFPDTTFTIDFNISDAPVNRAIQMYMEHGTDVIIAPCNDTRQRINEGTQVARFGMAGSGIIQNGLAFGKFKRFHLGEPVVYVKSDPPSEALGWLRNGMVGIVSEVVTGHSIQIDWTLASTKQSMRLLPKKRPIGAKTLKSTTPTPTTPTSTPTPTSAMDVYSPFACGIELAYCITGHKSQGSEYDRVAIVLDARDTWMLSKALDRRWLYTSASRSKRTLAIICKDAAGLRTAIGKPLKPLHPLVIEYGR